MNRSTETFVGRRACWKAGFTDALHGYLIRFSPGLKNDAFEVYQKLESLTKQGKAGIWAAVAEQLGVEKGVAHNFYHNTWTKQFFDNIQPFRQEIRVLVEANLDDFCVQDLVKEFLAGHPDKKFGQHQVLEAFHGIHSSLLKKKGTRPAHAPRLKKADSSSDMASQSDLADIKTISYLIDMLSQQLNVQ